MAKIIGIQDEMAKLNRLYNSDKPELTQRNLPKCGDVERDAVIQEGKMPSISPPHKSVCPDTPPIRGLPEPFGF